ncbi:hypothetical protein QYM36_006005, partial [Artemia franciscana]
FDSSLGGLTLSDQFLQISTLFSMDAIFGFGENEQPSLRHDMNWKIWALWARDQAPNGAANMYGTQPYYTALEPNGDAHGVLILNSNAQGSYLSLPGGTNFKLLLESMRSKKFQFQVRKL